MDRVIKLCKIPRYFAKGFSCFAIDVSFVLVLSNLSLKQFSLSGKKIPDFLQCLFLLLSVLYSWLLLLDLLPDQITLMMRFWWWNFQTNSSNDSCWKNCAELIRSLFSFYPKIGMCYARTKSLALWFLKIGATPKISYCHQTQWCILTGTFSVTR